jgi:alpha-1,6-mannosyltransferase
MRYETRTTWPRTALVAALGCALLAGVWAVHAYHAPLSQRHDVAVAGGLLVVCGAASVLLWSHGRRRDLAIVLVVALAARLLLAFDPPRLSNDAYRFVWDGRVQAAGINPYRHPPAAASLVGLRDFRIFTHVNRPYTITLYPPASEATFLAIHETAGDGVTQLKLSWIAIEAVAVALLLVILARTRLPAGRVVLYAWNPLAIIEIAGSGHPDALLVALTLASLLLWDRARRVGAGVVLAAAALTKFVPILLAPFMFRRLGARFAAALVATAAALYVPYLGAGTAALGSVGAYSRQVFGTGPHHWLTALGVPDSIARAALLLALALAVAWTAAHPPRDLAEACRYAALLLAGSLLASQSVLPWYLLWVLPLLCVSPEPALLWACSTVSVYYVASLPARIIPEDVASVIVWGPTVALLAAGTMRSMSRRLAARAAAEPAGAEAGTARAPAEAPV